MQNLHNPFEILYARLSNIEALLIDIKHQPTATAQPIPDAEPFGDFGWLCDTCQGIPPSTLRIKSAAGQIPGTKKVGKRVLYEKAAVLGWLHAHPDVKATNTVEVEQAAEVQVSTRIAARREGRVA